jgi:hypothetical protein
MFAFFRDLQTGFFKSDYSGVADEWVDKYSIRYTQDSIKEETQDGYNLMDVIRQLENGTIDPKNIPVIRVFKRNGKTYSQDNRRLYVFKQAKTVEKVPVKYWYEGYDVSDENFTTKNDGFSIRVPSPWKGREGEQWGDFY